MQNLANKGSNDLLIEQQGAVLQVTLNRPKSRNAMSQAIVQGLIDLFAEIHDRRDIRAVVLRGSGGNFCSGGDLKDMSKARQLAATEGKGAYVRDNRLFGAMIERVNVAPQTVITILEGAVLGGGVGLACVSDIAIARADAMIGLPETGLGIPPAQIAPFVVSRIGLTQARKLALLGARISGQEAHRLGMVHDVVSTEEEQEALLQQVLQQISRCAPEASAITKDIMLRVSSTDLNTLLDFGAQQFAEAVEGEEGSEGTRAFVEKRLPSWASNNQYSGVM